MTEQSEQNALTELGSKPLLAALSAIRDETSKPVVREERLYRIQLMAEDALRAWQKQHTARVGCNVCGGRLVRIRGRHPGDSPRCLCPTCFVEQIEATYKDCLFVPAGAANNQVERTQKASKGENE